MTDEGKIDKYCLKRLDSDVHLGKPKFVFLCILSLLLAIPGFTQDFLFPRVDQQLTGVLGHDFPSKFDVKWSFKTDSEIKSTPLIVKDKIVVSSTDAHLYCLEKTGKLLWSFKAENAFEASPVIRENIIYVGDLSGRLYAINLADGTKRWEYQTDNQILATANWYDHDGQTYILVGSYDYSLYCVKASTGDSLWTYELDNFLNGAVAIENSKVVFGGCDGFLHCVDIVTGKLQSKYDIATYIASSPCLENNIAYVGDYDGVFMAVDLKDQKTIWKYNPVDSNLPFIASPSVYKDWIISTNRDKHVYCFNKMTGELIWNKSIGFKIDASPLVSKEGKVLVVNMRGDIVVLDIETGQTEHQFELGSPVFSNPAVNSNSIVIGANDGNLYYLEEIK
jgi:eukaryotic-like serine/threonine-protein kinase